MSANITTSTKILVAPLKWLLKNVCSCPWHTFVSCLKKILQVAIVQLQKLPRNCRFTNRSKLIYPGAISWQK